MEYSAELTWLVALSIITAAMWMPYILESFVRRGIFETMGNPTADDPPLPAWADRAKRAHMNAVDNLVVFAPILIGALLLGAAGGTVLLAVKVYVLARLAHYVIYVAGIPVLRTVTFLIGFFATAAIAVAALGAVG